MLQNILQCYKAYINKLELEIFDKVLTKSSLKGKGFAVLPTVYFFGQCLNFLMLFSVLR